MSIYFPLTHVQCHIRAQLWRQKDAEHQARKMVLFETLQPET